MFCRLLKPDFTYLVSQIVEQFKGEDKITYYQASYVSNVGEKKSSTGLLYEVYKNERTRAICLWYCVARKKSETQKGIIDTLFRVLFKKFNN